jgi:ketosteroid isomerase-like protein
MTGNIDRTRAQFEAFDRQDIDAILASYHQDAVLTDHGARQTAKGLDEIREYYAAQFAFSSDQAPAGLDIMAAGDWTVIRGTLRGTHDGPLAGLQATGRSFEGSYCNLVRWEGGKAVEDHVYYDLYSLLEQLGQVPALTESA